MSRCEQLFCMGKRGFINAPRKHAGNFRNTLFSRQHSDISGKFGRFMLFDKIMGVSHYRNLRQMRDHDELMRLRQVFQHSRQRERGLASNTRIDLVKNERIDIIATAQHHLERQHHTTDLTARSDSR